MAKSRGPTTPDEKFTYFLDLLGADWREQQYIWLHGFLEQDGAPGRWWHRPPSMPAIVPLLYWDGMLAGQEMRVDEPHGYWRGDPQKVLGRLLDALFEFSDAWLGDDRLEKNVRNMFTSPRRFNSFTHELQFASRLNYGETRIEPLFFDPGGPAGGPDIRMHQSGVTFDIQCKTRDPQTATGLPYDSYLYLAGLVARAAHDSQHSIAVHLHVTAAMKENDVDMAAKRIKSVGSSRLSIPSSLRRRKFDLWVHRPEMRTQVEMKEFVRSLTEGMNAFPWYFDTQELPGSDSSITGPRSMFIVTGFQENPLQKYVTDLCRQIARDYSGSNPLIPAIHLHQELDIQEFWNRPEARLKLDEWEPRFFRDHPDIPAIVVGSNNHKYWTDEEGNERLATNYLAIDNPNWDGPEPQFGVSV